MRVCILIVVIVLSGFQQTSTQSFYTSFKTPEGFLVILGVITCIVIMWQAWETRKAAESAKRSVKLQEIMQQQWIQVSGWRIEDRSSAEESPPRFTIVMDICNPTSAPLTLQSISMRGAGKSVGVGGGGIQNILAPKECFKFGYKPALKPEDVARYRTSELVLELKGSIFYVDAFGNRKEQPFSQSCVCGLGSAEFSPFQIASA
jgi:hypothetical protein